MKPTCTGIPNTQLFLVQSFLMGIKFDSDLISWRESPTTIRYIFVYKQRNHVVIEIRRCVSKKKKKKAYVDISPFLMFSHYGNGQNDLCKVT